MHPEKSAHENYLVILFLLVFDGFNADFNADFSTSFSNVRMGVTSCNVTINHSMLPGVLTISNIRIRIVLPDAAINGIFNFSNVLNEKENAALTCPCCYLWTYPSCSLFCLDGLNRFRSSCDKRSYRCIVIYFMLLFSGLEQNPGPVNSDLTIGLNYLNVRSMVRKGALIQNLIEEAGDNGDVFVFTESRFTEDDTDTTRYSGLPVGYSAIFHDRPGTTSRNRGGGIAVFYRNILQLRDVTKNFVVPTSIRAAGFNDSVRAAVFNIGQHISSSWS